MSAYKSYWTAYGGLIALFKSPYMLASIIFTLSTNPLWFKPDGHTASELWANIVFSTLPSLTAFSLGAIAIFIALTKGLFLETIQEGGESSFFMKVVAAFFHFILIQISALLSAILFSAFPNNLTSGFSYFLFIYAIFAGLAAAAILVDVAEIKNLADPLEDEKDG
ncbi:hypothetical protein J4E08_15470 [Sagittula sp. NFXS13]|uniref:hypothetical protein n=1 Tax=Sagittula sp. NFXS13 TaxID=2819095 RepID=UPI0032DFAC97